MKLALPSRDNQIDNHFGHCEYFTVYTIDTGKKEVLNTEVVPSPEGCGCKSNIASVLQEKGVTLMLAGNMGNGAVNVLKHAGIEVVRGCTGSLDNVLNSYLSGSLTDSGIGCDHHDCNH